MIRRTPALTWYAIIVAVTIVLALILPVDTMTLHKFHITVLEYREAIITIIIPYIIIWFAAFYAYDRTDAYAQELEGTGEWKAFRNIAYGLGALAWGLAISTIISVVLGGIAGQHSGIRVVHTIIGNYLNLLFPLVGFTLIGNGTHNLLLQVKARLSLWATRLWVSMLAIVGVFYTYFLLHNHFTNDNPYHLPVILLLLTLAAPYLYVWYTGIVAAYELKKYSGLIKGVLYQRALNTLGVGLTIVIASSIFIQYITGALGSGKGVSFSYTLLIVYTLILLEAAGYVMVAMGARRLKRIEEV